MTKIDRHFVAAMLLACHACGSPSGPAGDGLPTGWTDVSAGVAHACGLSDGGTAYCWGDNEFGQLGDGTTSLRSYPVRVSTSETFASIQAGDQSTCGLTGEGEAWCWGRNDVGQLGDGSLDHRLLPSRVEGGPYTTLAVGSYVGCGLHMNGGTECWGGDRYGTYLGSGASLCPGPYAGDAWGCSSVPVWVESGLPLRTLSLGVFHACGLLDGGSAACWGAGNYGQLGPAASDICDSGVPPAGPPVSCSYQPIELELSNLSAIEAGSSHTCATTAGGRGLCWGGVGLDYGELGDGDPVGSEAPRVVGGLPGVSSLHPSAVGRLPPFTCGLDAVGKAWCWGAGEEGQLGRVPTGLCAGVLCSPSPSIVPGDHTYATLVLGRAFVCGLGTEGVIYCWGDNESGQLGDGSRVSRPTPMPVKPSDVTQ